MLRKSGATLVAIALSLLFIGCSDDGEAAQCESGESIDANGEVMRFEQNVPVIIDGVSYAVGNIGMRDTEDGTTAKGANLIGADGQSSQFFDCDVVDIAGTNYQAKIESTEVIFTAVAPEG